MDHLVDRRGATGENSEGNEKYVIRKLEEALLYEESLAKLYPVVIQKAKHEMNSAISKQCSKSGLVSSHCSALKCERNQR